MVKQQTSEVARGSWGLARGERQMDGGQGHIMDIYWRFHGKSMGNHRKTIGKW